MKTKNKTSLLMIGLIVVVGLAVMALVGLPAGSVGAWQLPTPTSGGFVIPTSTPSELVPSGAAPGETDPGGEVEAESAVAPLEGGPTTAPSGTLLHSGPFPRLSYEQLEALSLQASDVPAEFAESRAVTRYSAADSVARLNEAQAGLGDQLDELITAYEWPISLGVRFTACVPQIPVTEIYGEVGQFGSPEMGRAFFEDPRAEAFYAAMGFELSPAANVHGWLMTRLPQDGVCFPQEVLYMLNYEHQGLFLSASIWANADTDEALILSLLDQLSVIQVGKIDAQIGAALVPTPTPSASGDQMTPIANVLTPGASPSDEAIIAQLPGLMPTGQDLGLSDPPFTLDTETSGSFTPADRVALYKESGFIELARAFELSAEQNGMLAIETRLWDTGSQCPDTVSYTVSIAITLFKTPEGAAAHINNLTLQQAWRNTGIYRQFEPRNGGLLSEGVVEDHACGQAPVYTSQIPYNRVIISVSVTANPGADRDTVLAGIDAITNGMITLLTGAGL